MVDELGEQNRVLRARVAELERALASGVDPLLGALLEHAPGFLNVVTPDGRLVATGRTSSGFGSVIGRSMFDFIDASHHGVLREALERACATGAPARCEVVGYGENGEPGHSSIVRFIPVMEGGQVRAVVNVPTDITERARLERSLAESEQALRLAVDAAKIGLWRWDIARNAISWDKRMLEIWGLAETPADYETYRALLHPDDRSLVEAVVRDALETGVYRTFEHRLMVADVGERWILASGSVLKDASGKPSLLMGGIVDITEQKRMATRMERAERVESIGQLTAGIAHNFNNLLAAIIPNVELALAETGGPRRSGLSVALDASLQARDLVKSMLALARHRPAESRQPSDPKEVVVRVEAICRSTFPREIAIARSIDPSVEQVPMPESDLEQVLLNMCFNARDAVEAAGGPTRRIELRVDRVTSAEGVPRVRLQVVDSGIGMTEDIRRRIFEPFFSTKPPHQGSGLGLSNAAARVKEAGGRIDCESMPGAGTTFTLLLAEIPAPPRSEAAPKPPRAARRSETVLVVDDEPVVRGVLRRLLEDDGYGVLEAESAAAARDVLDREGARVSVIILDQSMPTETGVDALPSLRQRCQAPVVLFTGLAPLRHPGVAAVLEKPATRGDLQLVLRQVLSGES